MLFLKRNNGSPLVKAGKCSRPDGKVVILGILAIAMFLVCAGMHTEVRQQSQQQFNDSFPQREQQGQADPQNAIEILPASYMGCWRGMVAAPDILQNLNGCLNGPSVPELYTLCYRKTLTGKFELTFGSVAMDSATPPEYQVSGTRGSVEVLASDGVSRVKLRSFVRFDQKPPGSPPSADSKWLMVERTDMVCAIKDKDIEVDATFTQTSDGIECFKGSWHTRFHRFDD